MGDIYNRDTYIYVYAGISRDSVNRAKYLISRISSTARKFRVANNTFAKTFEVRSKSQTVRPIDQSTVVLTIINLHYKKGEFQLSELLAPLKL